MKKLLRVLIILTIVIGVFCGLLYYYISYYGFYDNPEQALYSSNHKVVSIIDKIQDTNEAVIFFITIENREEKWLGVACLNSEEKRGQQQWAITGMRTYTLRENFDGRIAKDNTYNFKISSFSKLDKLYFGLNEKNAIPKDIRNLAQKTFVVDNQEYLLWHYMGQ